MIYADPSHRKRTWQNWFYKLAALKKKKCNVSKDKAKKMGIDIGYWIFQAKSLTFAELEAKKEAPIRHWSRDHSLCGEWCYSKKAQNEGKIDIKKPLFDVTDAADKKSVDQVAFTSIQRLQQIHHPFTTQLNESVNMRIAEVAPKYKCFSCSRSLDYRIAHVICIHNLGIHQFIQRLFRKLNLPTTKVLLKWIQKKKVSRENKKKWDNNPDNKRKRAHKQKAKAKQQIYEERARDLKDGTYQSGVALNPEEPASKPKKTRKRKLCMCGGGREHSSSNYSECRRNKKNLKKLSTETAGKPLTKL